jgi:hypothetical protein
MILTRINLPEDDYDDDDEEDDRAFEYEMKRKLYRTRGTGLFGTM